MAASPATRTPASFTVGWVCALPIELAAAQLMMDEIYQNMPQHQADTNVYTYDRVGDHNVVIACLPAGLMGTSQTSSITARMQGSFPSLRFGVLVGIGGGVPTEEDDIRLGDVVISQPTGWNGGVVQFDFGKTGSDGEFTRTGSLNSPPTILLNALNKLRSSELLDEARASEHLSAFSKFRRFACPGPEQDVLYTAASKHLPGASNCDWCEKDGIISRQARDTSKPVPFFGTIASGNQVMKDALTRDRISQSLGGVLCFEMEAAGLMNTFPCLVVRGICDYADTHKNKKWQSYAAATAAAYAKELLRIVSPLVSETGNSPDETFNRITYFAPVSKNHLDCLRSLSFREQEFRGEDIRFAKDTCEWLLKNPEYQRWLNRSCGLFWIKGNPGAGKSALMKFAFTKMKSRQSNDLVLSFFIHGQGTDLQRSLLGVFRALLNSMLITFPRRLSTLTARFEDRERRFGSYQENRWEWTTEELQEFMYETLIEETKDMPVIMFVDALDESGKRNAKTLLNYFKDLMERIDQGDGKLKICFSSRHYPILDLDKIPSVSLEEQNGKDIQLVVHRRLKSIESEQARRELEDGVLSKSSGGFQWAVLVTDEMVDAEIEGKKEANLHKILASTPGTLDGLYARILGGGTRAEKAQMVKLFQWILFSMRPLSSQELREALSTDQDMTYTTVTQLKHHDSWVESLSHFERYIKNISRGLVEFQTREVFEQYEPNGVPWDREVRFIHQSVADHILENFLPQAAQCTSRSVAGAGHFEISRSCFKYICLTDVLAGTELSRGKLSNRFPLAPYAVQSFIRHIKEVEKMGISQLDILPLIQWNRRPESLRKIGHLWRVLDPEYAHAPTGWPFIGATSLHVFIACGLDNAFKEVLQVENPEIDTEDSQGNTPLLLAISERRTDMALTLLDRSSQWSVSHPDAVDKTINHKQGIDQQRSYFVDVNAENDDGDTPLTLALELQARDLILRLIEAGADVKLSGAEADFMSQAIRNRDRPLFMELIHRNVELDGAIYFLLQVLPKNDEGDVLIEFLSTLLNNGANTSRSSRYDAITPVQDDDDDDAILLASRMGKASAIEILLAHGVSANSQSKSGRTPLHFALRNRYFEIAQLLLEGGADFTIASNDGKTAFRLALDYNYFDFASITRHRNYKIASNNGRLLLCLALAGKALSFAELLLEEGVDPNIPSKNEWTPLDYAVAANNLGLAKLLFEKGAMRDSICNAEWLPLHATSTGNHIEVVSLLLENGANPNTISRRGWTPLDIASANGQYDIAELLLNKGADPNFTDNHGRIPLHSAALGGHLEVAILLLERGAIPNFENYQGRTPLDSALSNGHMGVAKLLRTRTTKLLQQGSSSKLSPRATSL